ncbi:AAA family ATPase [Luteolibacter flavescens]|uniref:AAA family ATPase n=1 Tax=Luteolibacter flavescens TaxID=1859460 RepID=A0ABT3FR54_9BACT|nr:AAA family ATPase [Luteolibacter flavescens]MCW1886062.1 AAA family ATPase [Luteolibacter flavescens]
MRLISLTLRNYRVHQELTVAFDRSRNLIGGANETGKSTLAEAIHRALFLRAKTGGRTQKEMVSTRHLGEPEIYLTFEAAGSTWELEKRFAGAKGSTRLTASGATPLKDDEAETRLAELLKSETASGGGAAKLLPTLWAHLWVWQGSSGDDPSGHASDHKDTLVHRLQQDGLAAVMQSATDQRVREHVAARYDELFTATGKLKAGSPPELARARLAEAEASLSRAREIAGRLEQAAAEHERSERELAEIDLILPGLREQKVVTDAKLLEVAELRRQEEARQHAWQTAATLARQLAEQDAAIRKLHEQADQSRDSLGPAERMEASLVAGEKEARELSQSAETSQRQSADAIRTARLRHDCAVASIAVLEKAADLARLTARAAEASQLRTDIRGQEEALSQLPAITAKDLEVLRQLDRAASQAEASLSAMATGIELIASDVAVSLDGQALVPGEARTLTDTGELKIGPGTRLRIHPGGGISLADARLRLEASRRSLKDALDRHTLRDLDQATAVLQLRQTLTQQIAQLEIRWKALGGEVLSAELTAAGTAHEAAKSELERRHAAAGSPDLPGSHDAAQQLRATLQQTLDEAEKAEAVTRHHAAQLRERFEAAAAKLQAHGDQAAQARQSLRDLETKLRILQETHGDATAREAALVKARDAEQAATGSLAATKAALVALSPDALAADLDRFVRAIAQQEARRREAENLRLIARERLTLDGSTDPQAELSHALARHVAALEIHASQQRRARAIEQLHQLFSSCREGIDRALVQPLADRITGYLQCLFGPAAQARVNVSDTGIEGLEIIRSDDSTFGFSVLSGGAREQVAAAVRLALAEILAADHDGCLPVLFDDAFAYTDPARIQSLQRMLDLAALRGLQVIVLTCTPVDYSAFGGKTIGLR